MPVKVSVIVPVYNTGTDIDRNIDSMLAQTLPPEEYEVIYVDDGSTDDTPAKLDKLAAEHPQVKVWHIPNSGWPGRPRNIGIANARGEFVQFVDDDDFMAPDALGRLYELGARGKADIVIGKMASNFRAIAHSVFKQNRDRCSILDSDVIYTMTGHKMFRRSFLDEHGIRFREGKWLMEDLMFTAEAYASTKRVAVLADYTCYYWWGRTEGSHGSGGLHDRKVWFDHLGQIMDAFTAKLPPSKGRDRAMGRVYRIDLLGPLMRRIDWDDPEQGFDAWYGEARAALASHMPPTVGPAMGVFLRVAADLLERGERDRLIEWFRHLRSVGPRVELQTAAWDADGAIRVGFTAELIYRGKDPRPLKFERRGDRTLLDPALAERFGFAEDLLDVTDELGDFEVDLSMEHRDERVRWYTPLDLDRRFTDLPDGGSGIRFHGEGRLQTEAADGRERLARGLWDVSVGIAGFGVSRSARLGTSRAAAVEWDLGAAVLGRPARAVVPYFTNPKGELTIDVARKVKPVAATLAGRDASRIAGRRDAVVLDVATGKRTGPFRPFVAVVGASDAASAEAKGRARGFHGRLRLDLPVLAGTAPGPVRVFVRLDGAQDHGIYLGRGRVGADGRVRLGYDLPVWRGEPVSRRAARRLASLVPAAQRPRAKRLLKRVLGRGVG